MVQCEMRPDRTDVFFNFSKPFEINDDKEILKRMGKKCILSKINQNDTPRYVSLLLRTLSIGQYYLNNNYYKY